MCPSSPAEPARAAVDRRRSAAGRRRSRCRARSSPRAGHPRAAPARASASSAALRVVVDHAPAARAARSSGRGTARRRAAGGSTSATRPSPHSTSAGIPNPTASTSGAAARTSSTASTKMSSVSCAIGSAPGPVHPVVDHEPLVDDARRAASCPPRRCRSRASAAWPDDIQRGVTDPTPGPPEYKVYRSRRRPLERRGGDLDALKQRLSRGTATTVRARRARARASAHHPRPGAQVGRASRSAAGCCSRSCCSWSARRSRTGVSRRRRARALERRQPASAAATSSCSAPTPARATRSTESQAGPGARRHDHARPRRRFGSVRKLSIPRDTEVEHPRPRRAARSTPPTRSAGPALTIQTVEGFLGNGLKINHLVEVDFKDFPAVHRRARRHHGATTRRGSARRRSTTSGRGSTSARASSTWTARRALGYSRVRKNPCAPDEDDRDRAAPPAGGAAGDRLAGQVAQHVLPAALGELEGAAARSRPT